MKTKTSQRRTAGAAPGRAATLWQLRQMYVMDSTPKVGATAYTNLKEFCESNLKGRYRITVIDLEKHPQLGEGQIKSWRFPR